MKNGKTLSKGILGLMLTLTTFTVQTAHAERAKAITHANCKVLGSGTTATVSNYSSEPTSVNWSWTNSSPEIMTAKGYDVVGTLMTNSKNADLVMHASIVCTQMSNHEDMECLVGASLSQIIGSMPNATYKELAKGTTMRVISRNSAMGVESLYSEALQQSASWLPSCNIATESVKK